MKKTGTVLIAASAYAALHWLGRNYGSTREERVAELPGGNLVADPHLVTTHAITIDAPPDRVWPWLVQMGWHRGGWYTARWVDRLLFPNNGPSADRIIPELQHLELGDFVPDGPPETECGFVVEVLDVNRSLVLHSTSHLPLSWRQTRGAQLDWSWAFVLQPLDQARRTRFLFRTRCRLAPWWVRVGYRAAVVPADFVMSRDMLHGVKRRAERAA